MTIVLLKESSLPLIIQVAGETTDNIELSHWYKVDKVFYTPEAKLRCVKITSYITKRS